MALSGGNLAHDRFDHGDGKIPMMVLNSPVVDPRVVDPREQRIRLERVKDRISRQSRHGQQSVSITTNYGARMSIGNDGSDKISRRNSELSLGAQWIEEAVKGSGYQGVPPDFLQAAQLASKMHEQSRKKTLTMPGEWEWATLSTPADSLAVIENAEECIRQYNATVCLAHDDGFTPGQRKAFQRQVSALRISMHQRIEILAHFLNGEKKKACRRHSRGKSNPTVDEQVSGLAVVMERLGNALRHRPEELELAYALQHLKAQLTYDDTDEPNYPEGWLEAATMPPAAQEDSPNASSRRADGNRRRNPGQQDFEAECAELEEPSAFDIGKKKKKTEEPPASQGSIFDNIKSGTYTRSKPVGNPEPMASWGYSMSPLPPRGRRPSIDSDASKGDQDWKIVKVPLEGTGAEALMMGLQPLEKAAQGVPNGIKQYRQAVAHNKSMGIEDSPGLGPVNAEGGTAPLLQKMPEYYLPQATIQPPLPPLPLEQLTRP